MDKKESRILTDAEIEKRFYNYPRVLYVGADEDIRDDKLRAEGAKWARDFINATEKQSSIEFGDWLNQHSYEPLAIFPLQTNRKWSSDDGETSFTTEQLYKEYEEEKQLISKHNESRT